MTVSGAADKTLTVCALRSGPAKSGQACDASIDRVNVRRRRGDLLVSMANEPKAPAQLPRLLDECSENSDKESEIELYYELLSSGHSVGEILNGVGPAHGEAEQDRTAAAEQPQSRRDGAPTESAGAYASGDRDAAPDFGDQERFLSRSLPGIAMSIAFWALYTGAVASASIAGFTLLRGGRDADPTIAVVQSGTSHEPEAVPKPGAAVDRPAAVAESVTPRAQAAAVGGLQMLPRRKPARRIWPLLPHRAKVR